MKYLVAISILIFLFLPLLASAQLPRTPCDSIAGYPNTFKVCYLIGTVATLLYYLGLALGIVVIIIGGITYMTAGADESKVANAKKIILYGLIGVAIILLSGFLINLLQEVVVNSLR
jgi:hypothetical protein